MTIHYDYVCYFPPILFIPQVSSDPGNQYYVSLMNALVLYVGTQAIAYIHSKERTPSTTTIAHTAHMDIFQHLVVDLDTEGKEAFISGLLTWLLFLYKWLTNLVSVPLSGFLLYNIKSTKSH